MRVKKRKKKKDSQFRAKGDLSPEKWGGLGGGEEKRSNALL